MRTRARRFGLNLLMLAVVVVANFVCFVSGVPVNRQELVEKTEATGTEEAVVVIAKDEPVVIVAKDEPIVLEKDKEQYALVEKHDDGVLVIETADSLAEKKVAEGGEKTADGGGATAIDDAAKSAEEAAKSAEQAAKTLEAAIKVIEDASKTVDEAAKSSDEESLLKSGEERLSTATTVNDAAKSVDDAVKTIDEATRTVDEAVKVLDESVKAMDESAKFVEESAEKVAESTTTGEKAAQDVDGSVQTENTTNDGAVLDAAEPACVNNATHCACTAKVYYPIMMIPDTKPVVCYQDPLASKAYKCDCAGTALCAIEEFPCTKLEALEEVTPDQKFFCEQKDAECKKLTRVMSPTVLEQQKKR